MWTSSQVAAGYSASERHSVVYKAVTGEGASLDVEAKEKWEQETLPRILDNYVDAHIYNSVETGLFSQMLPFKTHALKGDTCGKNSKLRLTVFFAPTWTGVTSAPHLSLHIKRSKRKVVLVLDDCIAHRSMPKLSNMEVFFLHSNTMAGLQSMDAGMIANFKVMYRRHILSKIVLLMDMAARKRRREQPDMKSNLLLALQFIFGAWSEVGTSMVRNCFR
ncbi:hypothetical protein HPB49_003529 [Dermacentor silvarum]|uniref:Uncharacterized protein n=1 Tax=Dermacentor silvarum TaxID=543639 RepID=A0ACB8DTB6_DERSI|nr:hypothetical protein HPB49_003529 [Dermacentor silvarum]